MTSKLDRFNRNGDLLCEAFGCRKHKRLYQVFGGIFCRKHQEELAKIRTRITHDGYDLDARLEEIRFRKFLCPKHMVYALRIEEATR